MKQFLSKHAELAGSIAGYGVLFSGLIIGGYLLGMLIMWALMSVFGAKLGASLYVVLWGACGFWVWLTVFKRDKYGFRS